MWERDGHRLRCKICGFRVISELDAKGHEKFHMNPRDELEALVEAYGPQEARRRWAEWQTRKRLLGVQACGDIKTKVEYQNKGGVKGRGAL